MSLSSIDDWNVSAQTLTLARRLPRVTVGHGPSQDGRPGRSSPGAVSSDRPSETHSLDFPGARTAGCR